MIKNDSISDKNILELSMKNPQYFELLVDRYQGPFLRKSASLMHSMEEAEDIVQETFLKIYKYGRKFKEQDGATFKSWAYEILRNTCYDYYNRQKRYRSRVKAVDLNDYEFEDTSTPTPLAEARAGESRNYIESILAIMPKSLSDVLRLYFLEGKSQKEIASIKNISAGAVRTRIHRAKTFFRNISTHSI